MFYKPLSEIDLTDLQLLVSNKFQEGTRLDYKLTEPDKSDDGKKNSSEAVWKFLSGYAKVLRHNAEARTK